MKHWIVVLTLLIAGLEACRPPQHTDLPATVVYHHYDVRNDTKVDSQVWRMVRPYADSLHLRMGKVIGFSNDAMAKKQPSSALGNLMADAMLQMAAEAYGMKVDAAFMNPGGIRSTLPKGNITVGTIYELMPFDNLVVLQKLDGQTLQAFLDHTAEKGGWPVAGLTMKIRNKKAVDVLVGGEPLRSDRVYVVANSDYIASGGDDARMLKGIPVMNRGYLYRDALISYVQRMTLAGRPIEANHETRVTYAN